MIAKDPSPDSTLALLREGYDFIPARCRRLGADAFDTRLMLRRATCWSGPEASAQFFVPGRFSRRGALPAPVFALIQDFGSVMALDGEDHAHRKAMFLEILRPGALHGLMALTEEHFRRAARGWARTGEITLFDAAHEPLTAAVCEWSGLRLGEGAVRQRAHEMMAMVEGTGSVGPRHLRGHWHRRRTERWARAVIRAIRAGEERPPEGSAASVIARHRGRDGRELDEVAAGVELLNILRTTAANARYVMFVAMALHAHPEWRARLAADEAWEEPFVQEVRRFFPFIPFMGGIVREEFRWRDRDFRPGDWVLMDLFGTNRDARAWEAPDRFDPARFRGRPAEGPGFIPQGGGDRARTHRCPGEGVTVGQMRVAARLLARDVSWEVPAQDLSLPPARLPALPPSRFRMRVLEAA